MGYGLLCACVTSVDGIRIGIPGTWMKLWFFQTRANSYYQSSSPRIWFLVLNKWCLTLIFPLFSFPSINVSSHRYRNSFQDCCQCEMKIVAWRLIHSRYLKHRRMVEGCSWEPWEAWQDKPAPEEQQGTTLKLSHIVHNLKSHLVQWIILVHFLLLEQILK